jgi:hypothetical protein
LLSLVAWLAGIGVVEAQLPTFTDVTESSGIDFEHSFGDHDLTNIVEGTGAGAMFFDYDGDGTFTDVTANAGVGDRGYGFGCSAADFE